jgi:hypothetical protein
MALTETSVPCVPLPEVPEIPSVMLPGGAELKALLNFAEGIPDDCTVTFNLMGQLAPALASLSPILQILTVLKALADFASNPLVKGPDLIEAIDKLESLIFALTPGGMALTVRGVLNLIVNLLGCFVEQLESVVKVQAELVALQAQLEASPQLASPVLTASISCATANAKISMDQTMAALGPIEPLFGIVTLIAGIAELPLSLPSLSGAGDVSAMIESTKSAVDTLKDVIQSLPG